MIPTTSSDRLTVSTLNAPAQRAYVDDGALAHVIRVLQSALYNRPYLAPVRELCTNGWDAHVEAGNLLQPIEVTLPTALNPTFTVRDYGVGISPDGIHAVFGGIGTSTKRGTNEQTGYLGFGSKSPYAIAEQYNVVSVHGGVKTTALCAKDTDGVGTVTIVDTCATEEPNGTTVQVPIRDVGTLLEEAAWFFHYSPILANVDGEPNVSIFDANDPTVTVLDPDVLIDTEASRNIIVQGNVPYYVEGKRTHGYGPQPITGWVARVAIGSVEFGPNRESTTDVPLTQSTVATIQEFVSERLGRRLAESVDQADTPWEAVQRWHKAHNTYRKEVTQYVKRTWHGQEIPLTVKAPHIAWHRTARSRQYSSLYGTHYGKGAGSGTMQVNQESITRLAGATVVTGYRNGSITDLAKESLEEAYANGVLTPTAWVIFCDTLAWSKWMPVGDNVVDWEEIKIKRARAARGSRATGWKVFQPSASKPTSEYLTAAQVDDLDDLTLPLCWVEADAVKGEDSRYGGFGHAVVVVPANRKGTWDRNYGHVPHVKDAVCTWATLQMDLPNLADYLQGYSEEQFRSLAPQALDPIFAPYLGKPSGVRARNEEAIQQARQWGVFGIKAPGDALATKAEEIHREIEARYGFITDRFTGARSLRLVNNEYLGLAYALVNLRLR